MGILIKDASNISRSLCRRPELRFDDQGGRDDVIEHRLA